MATSNSSSKNSFISLNNCTLTGRISRVDSNEDRTYARFSVAHNMGKKNDTLYLEFVIFASKKAEIPFDLIQKGKAVKVNAFFRQNNLRDADGNITRYANQLVVKSIEAISSKEADAEPDDAE